ncbi:unnamed protein product [Rotaria socialis]|uniref:Uncharacterized protein n=2 Tax=Rotaria socialis TaxID=392032 RepID=A0A817YR55_9BILA|nr:unnamed protein product [Rotaria socialis]CAF3772425.1 unnamed protein product [Rotaria socialis]CAF4492055.1 unnamed protein product [Rotaria socialis]
MLLRNIIILVFVMLFSINISNIAAYWYDDDQIYMNNVSPNNVRKDSNFIQQLQPLLTAMEVADGKSDKDDTSSVDRVFNTRSTVHRRPGLLRLKKK